MRTSIPFFTFVLLAISLPAYSAPVLVPEEPLQEGPAVVLSREFNRFDAGAISNEFSAADTTQPIAAQPVEGRYFSEFGDMDIEAVPRAGVERRFNFEFGAV
jgi:hypothetical protein